MQNYFSQDCKAYDFGLDNSYYDADDLRISFESYEKNRPSVWTRFFMKMLDATVLSKRPFKRHTWQFDKAERVLIERSMSEFQWESVLTQNTDPDSQVDILNSTLLNTMSNFVPNYKVNVNPNAPKWITRDIKNLMRRQNKLYKKYKRNGFIPDDKVRVDTFRNECFLAINKSKHNYLNNLDNKLTDNSTGQKTYWKIVNSLMNKCKIPRIPPLLVADKFIINCKEKANIFNEYFLLQCKPISNGSTLPFFQPLTNTRLRSLAISRDSILSMINELNVNKAYGADEISVHMIKLCGNSICLPLHIMFNNIIDKGVFPNTWKMANVTPVHKKIVSKLLIIIDRYLFCPFFPKSLKK